MAGLAPTQSILPETLQDVWDDELRAKYGSLSFSEQTFVLEILKGSKKGDAYQKAYPQVSDAAKGACASGLLKRAKVVDFLESFRTGNLDSLFLIRNRLQSVISGEIVEIDYDGKKIPVVPTVRDMVVAGQALAKLDGLNAAEKVEVDATKEIRDFVGSIMAGK